MTKTFQEVLSSGVSLFDIMGTNDIPKLKCRDELKKFIKNPLWYLNPKQATVIKNKIMKEIGTTSPIFISICSACLRGIPCRNESDGRVKQISIKFNNKTIKLDYCYGDIEKKKKNLFVGLHIQDFKFNEKPFKVVEITPYVAPVILTQEEIIKIEKKKIKEQIEKALDSSNFPSLAPKKDIEYKEVDNEDEWYDLPKTKSKKATIKFTIKKKSSSENQNKVSWSDIIVKEQVEEIPPAPTLIIKTDTSKVQELKMENPIILSTKKYSKPISLINKSKIVENTSEDDFEEDDFEEDDFEEEYEEQEELSWDDDPQWE
jgi:hypothetical protein